MREQSVRALRHRIEVEDNLLNSRTTIFLAINGLWVAAIGFVQNAPNLIILAYWLPGLFLLTWLVLLYEGLTARGLIAR